MLTLVPRVVMRLLALRLRTIGRVLSSALSVMTIIFALCVAFVEPLRFGVNAAF